MADGAAIDTSKIGYQTFTVTAKDKAGTETTKSVTYVVNSTDVGHDPGRNVPATLALSLGTRADVPARSRRASTGPTTRARRRT